MPHETSARTSHQVPKPKQQTSLRLNSLLLRKTLTYDQGREMSKHAQLTERTGVAVYFCDPHSPWQRGLNENTNGLLRQYLPKGADLSVYTQEQLDEIAWSLNTRPRKSLGFRSPVEVYGELLHNMELAKTATKH